MEKQIERFKSLVCQKLPKAVLEVDSPGDRLGNWWIDVRKAKKHVAVEYRPTTGFGIFGADAGYGERPSEIYGTAELAVRRLAQLLRSNKGRHPRLTLKDLRELYTCSQVELAAKVGVKQSAISRLEQRNEVKLGTLAAAVKALGGELEVRARFPDSDVPICVKD